MIDFHWTAITYIRRLIKSAAPFLFEILTGLVAGWTGCTFNAAEHDFSTGICFFTVIAVYTKVFGIVKSAFVIPVGQAVCLHLFGDGSGILTEEACDILKRSTFGKLILDVNTIIQS